MQRILYALAVLLLATASVTAQQRVGTASTVLLRALDKITGETVDITLQRGQMASYGQIQIILGECRFPEGAPSSDAFALLEIRDIRQQNPVFLGWMVASSPALNALDHPRYDVWVLRCSS